MNSRTITAYFLTLSLALSSVAQTTTSGKLTAVDELRVQMGLSKEASSKLAIEVLGQLDGQQRMNVLRQAEQNAKDLKAELRAEEARLAKAIDTINANQLSHTTYDVTGVTRFVFLTTGVITGFASAIIATSGGFTTPLEKSIKKAFWTSVALGAISFATRNYLSTKVEFEVQQLTDFKNSVQLIREQAKEEQQNIEALKKFYRIDIDVNINQ
jgi:hypothetical protein